MKIKYIFCHLNTFNNLLKVLKETLKISKWEKLWNKKIICAIQSFKYSGLLPFCIFSLFQMWFKCVFQES